MGVVVFLLLLLSGDVETNPGPVGEVLCLTVSDVSPAEPDCHTKSFFCVRVWLRRTSRDDLFNVSSFNHEKEHRSCT